ncbi:MAG: hypothetical protein D6748_05490 [Calditrichaeota bacterium]|nr:MAG: hypothetical protein D6748_05490 [Calditrichota bacterium]
MNGGEIAASSSVMAAVTVPGGGLSGENYSLSCSNLRLLNCATKKIAHKVGPPIHSGFQLVEV